MFARAIPILLLFVRCCEMADIALSVVPREEIGSKCALVTLYLAAEAVEGRFYRRLFLKKLLTLLAQQPGTCAEGSVFHTEELDILYYDLYRQSRAAHAQHELDSAEKQPAAAADAGRCAGCRRYHADALVVPQDVAAYVEFIGDILYRHTCHSFTWYIIYLGVYSKSRG